jgi:hypothetical protein
MGVFLVGEQHTSSIVANAMLTKVAVLLVFNTTGFLAVQK